MDDPFIREHIEDLLRNIRTQVRSIARLYDWDLRLEVIRNYLTEEFVNF